MKEKADIMGYSYSILAISARRVRNTFHSSQDYFNSEDPALSLMQNVDLCAHEIKLQDELLKALLQQHFQYYLERLRIYIKNISDPYNSYLLLSFSISSFIFAHTQRRMNLYKQNVTASLREVVMPLFDELNPHTGPGYSLEEAIKHKQLLQTVGDILESKGKKDILENMYLVPHFMPNEIVYLQALSKSNLSTLV